MENKELIVPYIAYESAMARAERRDKRFVIVIIVLVAMLAASNIAWLAFWNQFDIVDGYSVDVESDDGGNANYIGNDGDIYNGTSKSNQNTENDSQ